MSITSFGQRALGRVASAITLKPAVRLDKGPMCTFTFDDCPLSALQQAGAALERRGLAGTFFVSAGVAAHTRSLSDPLMYYDDFSRALSAGHEIGCHTFSHPHMRTIQTEGMRAEFDKNLAAIREQIPDVVLSSFAYPYGEVSFRAKLAVADRFAVARGTRPGLNTRIVDLSDLRSYSLRARTFDEGEIRVLVANAVRRRAWLVFTCHDVCDQPSEWGCTPTQFGVVLQAVTEALLPVLTLKAALGRMMHRTQAV